MHKHCTEASRLRLEAEKSRHRNLRKAATGFSSFHLKGSFIAAFFFALGELALRECLFSTGATVDARQGKQLFERIPQLSNKPSSLLLLPLAEEEISSRNTGCTSL